MFGFFFIYYLYWFGFFVENAEKADVILSHFGFAFLLDFPVCPHKKDTCIRQTTANSSHG